jgi:4-hydroxybenzoate polyprenyltransferase
MIMPNKFFLSLKLMRLQSPTGYFLVFFPACFGLLLTNSSIESSAKLLVLLFLGSVITRSAGCVINDIFDKNYDKHVFRTKDRPLANNSLSIKEALVLLAILLFCSLVILLALNKTSIYLGLLAFIMIILYPLMKRIINLPQVFLGLTFNFGALIGSSSVVDKVTLESFIIYIACCFWTIAYDTIYGFMDMKDDKKIKIKSMALTLEKKRYKLHLYIYYTIFIILFIIANRMANHPVNYILIVLAYFLLIYQVATLNISDPKNCLTRFKNNNYVGLVLVFAQLNPTIYWLFRT